MERHGIFLPAGGRVDEVAPLPSWLSATDLGILKEIGVRIELAARQSIFLAPECCRSIWLVHCGTVSLSYGAPDGPTVLLLEAGDLFVMQEGKDGGEQVTALTAATLYRLTGGQAEELVLNYPHLGYRLVELAGRYSARLQYRLAVLMTRPVLQRLAALLVRLARQCGQDRGTGHYLDLDMTHEELARMVGASREMVSKVMRKLRRAGWVDTARRSLVRVDVAALEGFLEDASAPQDAVPHG